MPASIRVIAVLSLIVLSVGGVAALMADTARQARSPTALRPVDCWFPVMAGFRAACFRLRVPERRAAGETLYIELPVAMLSMAATRHRSDPVVYLAGGPGDGAWIDPERIEFWWSFMRDNSWLNQRDLVLVDQRGTGNVSPRMDCPELEALSLPFLALGRDPASAIRMSREAAARCHKRLVGEGHDPSSYTTDESASDLHDLHLAIARGPWNVYGLSYGTRLALAYLRRFPGDFRSVILDSTDPPHVDFYGDDARRTQRAFDTMIEACEQDGACRSWYPNLRSRLVALIERLNAAPIDFDVAGDGGTQAARVRLTGDLLLWYLFVQLYTRPGIESVPWIIDVFDRALAPEMKKEVGHLVEFWVDRPDRGEALALSIECAEEMPFADVPAVLSAYREFPLLRSLAEGPPPFTSCPVWPVRAVDATTREPVRSDAPALVMAGKFDPITPPEYGRQAAAALTNSWFFEFSSAGHDVLGSEPCAGRLAAMFLDNPTLAPNDPCLQALPPPRFLPPAE